MEVVHFPFLLLVDAALAQVVVLDEALSNAHSPLLLGQLGGLTHALEASVVVEQIWFLLLEFLVALEMAGKSLQDVALLVLEVLLAHDF